MSDLMATILEAKKQMLATDSLERHVGHHVYSVAQAARKIGLELRWPVPPFKREHIEILDSEWRFQLSWNLKLLNEQAKLLPMERTAHPLPGQPYTEESVRLYVTRLRDALKSRSFFSRFKSAEPLDAEHELLRTRCIQILRGNWMTSQILEDATWQLVRIPQGEFFQGDVNAVFDTELPAHKSKVGAFWLGATPVSEGLWQTVMKGREYKVSPDHAKVGVSWFEALRFCNALSLRCGLQAVYTLPEKQPIDPTGILWDFENNGYRLPTESEWEYASRGTARGLNQMPKGVDIEHMVDYPVSASDISQTPYSGSALIKEVGWYVGNSKEKHPAMGKKRSNGFGLYDMSGGVREWCMDGFGTYADKVESEIVQHRENRKKVCRGGAYALREQLCRVTSRAGFDFDSGNEITGLRIARSVVISDQ